MSYEITSESYGRRLPKITATATSTDDLATLGTDWAEGSTCTISDTTYKLDKVKGWVDPDSGGGGGGGAGFLEVVATYDGNDYTLSETWEDMVAAQETGALVTLKLAGLTSNMAPPATIMDFQSDTFTTEQMTVYWMEDQDNPGNYIPYLWGAQCSITEADGFGILPWEYPLENNY